MSSPETLPYIGSTISIISKTDVRYEGTLVAIDAYESTASLRQVKSYGTEGRRTPDVPPSPEIFEFIVFKGSDIKDLTVRDTEAPQAAPESVSSRAETPPSTYAPDQSAVSLENKKANARSNHVSGYSNTYTGYGRDAENSGYFDRGGRNSWNQNTYKRDQQYETSHRENYNYQQSPHMGRGNNQGVGNRGHDYSRRNNRHVIGELNSQPNAILKSEMSSDFDFDGAIAKFEKASQNGAMSGSQNALLKDIGGYNKKSSFFDSISCESLDRKEGREDKLDREKQMQLDVDTFGDAAANYRGSRFGFRRGRGRGGYRGKGGYGSGRGGYGRGRRYDNIRGYSNGYNEVKGA